MPTLVVLSGRRIPALVLEGGTTFSTSTRFREGISRFTPAMVSGELLPTALAQGEEREREQIVLIGGDSVGFKRFPSNFDSPSYSA